MRQLTLNENTTIAGGAPQITIGQNQIGLGPVNISFTDKGQAIPTWSVQGTHNEMLAGALIVAGAIAYNYLMQENTA